VKVFEGIYRDVNIALANELAHFVDEIDVDVTEAIDVANTSPYSDIHDPGAGVGGHCIPYYPYFLIEQFDTPGPLLRTAREVNDSMPNFTVGKVREGFDALGQELEDATVLVLGLTYRPGVEEIRAAPALGITELLSDAGAEVLAVDPLLDSIDTFAAEKVTLEEAPDRSVDGVVVVTPHEDFEPVGWDTLRGERDRLVIVDGRDAYDLSGLPDWTYTIGRG
jgi:UDP-N-acetyl-D-mannosaminuronic acid dehydrogenase